MILVIFADVSEIRQILRRTPEKLNSQLCVIFIDHVRGMMYCRRALKLQAFHDMAKESDSRFLSSGSVWRATNEDLALMRTCAVMCGFILSKLFDKTDALDDIVFPPVVTAQWEEQIRRLYLLLTVKESAVDVPRNLEAR
ncbi:hypothetical protein POM88_049600 [Heracleum sosnowskyi]|nr:hypothetical protein POM88_049600 [Heracleum sosnowskyi]